MFWARRFFSLEALQQTVNETAIDDCLPIFTGLRAVAEEIRIVTSV